MLPKIGNLSIAIGENLRRDLQTPFALCMVEYRASDGPALHNRHQIKQTEGYHAA
jgi:hypothetical protein